MSDANTTSVLIAAAESAAKSQDPTISSFLFVGLIVFLLILFAKPLMSLVKDAKGLSTAESKMKAEESLYEQLRTQVEANQHSIEKLNAEKDKWFEKAHQLEKEVEKLKHFEQMVEIMKKKLDEKDAIISTQNEENRRLMYEIIQLKDRIHELEIRLTCDEALIRK